MTVVVWVVFDGTYESFPGFEEKNGKGQSIQPE